MLKRQQTLSCLRGSEQNTAEEAADTIFLSCLRGSEPSYSQKEVMHHFLSCLRGSELAADASYP